MAITKIGNTINTKLEKRSSALLTGGILSGLHVGQNAAVRRAFRQPSVHKRLLDAFKRGGTSGSKTQGFTGAALPELTIFERQAGESGVHFFKKLKEKGINPEDLSKRDLVQMRRILRGDLEKAMKTDTDNSKAIIESMSDSIAPGTGVGESTKLMLDKGGDEAVREMEKLWKKNPLTGEMLKGVGDEMGKYRQVSSPSKGQKIGRGITTVGTKAGIGAIDPTTSAVNVAKRGIASPHAQKVKGLKQVQDKVQDTAFKNPIKRRFERGLGGEAEKHTGSSNFARTYLFNPATAQAQNFAQGVGRISSEQGVTQDMINVSKDTLKKQT